MKTRLFILGERHRFQIAKITRKSFLKKQQPQKTPLLTFNSHIIYFTHLKVNHSMVFSIFTDTCNYHHNQFSSSPKAVSCCSVTQSCLTLQPHGLQPASLPCPSPSPRACSNSCPLGQWCHPTILSSVIPFSSCLQSFPASGSFSMSWLFSSGDQSIGASASASVLPMNIQDWFPLGWSCLITLQSKGLSRVFSNTTV